MLMECIRKMVDVMIFIGVIITIGLVGFYLNRVRTEGDVIGDRHRDYSY